MALLRRGRQSLDPRPCEAAWNKLEVCGGEREREGERSSRVGMLIMFIHRDYIVVPPVAFLT